MEAYRRMRNEGAVVVAIYGTPHTQALTPLLHEDKIPGISPGFGTAAAANGKKYAYLFPISATYWSQGAAAVQFAKEQLGGVLKGKKIAYIFLDNPGGREPLTISAQAAGSGRFRTQGIRNSATRRRNEGTGARYHPPFPCRFRH